MPARDGTGPRGEGPVGAGYGPCSTYQRPQAEIKKPQDEDAVVYGLGRGGLPRGCGMGYGFGGGRGRAQQTTPSDLEEKVQQRK